MSPARRQSNSTWFFIGGVVVVVIIGVVAIALTRSDSDEGESGGGGSSEVAANVSLDGQALPVYKEGDDPAVGLRAPVARGENFAGEPVTIGEGGKPQIVVFLAHWCPHCQAEVPRIVALAESGGIPAAIDLVAVATGTSSDRENYPPSAWLESERWYAPVLLDTSNGSVASAYGLSGFPFFVVLDSDGNVIARRSGEQSEAQLRDIVAIAIDSMNADDGPDTGDTTTDETAPDESTEDFGPTP